LFLQPKSSKRKQSQGAAKTQIFFIKRETDNR